MPTVVATCSHFQAWGNTKMQASSCRKKFRLQFTQLHIYYTETKVNPSGNFPWRSFGSLKLENKF